MYRAFRFIGLALLFSVFCGPSYAQTDDLDQYKVEIIVLRNLNPVFGTEVFMFDQNLDEEELPSMRFSALAADDLDLGKMAARLANSKNYRVLSHFGWTQPGFPRDEAKRKIVLRNSANGESTSGAITLTRERYLRLHFDLTVRIDGETFQFDTQRRMISRQLHYFDHPHLGIIAKITPLDL